MLFLLLLLLLVVGAAGLAFMRVQAGGAIDAAKPIREGLDEQQLAALLAAAQAEEVCWQDSQMQLCALAQIIVMLGVTAAVTDMVAHHC